MATETVTAGMDANLAKYLLNTLDTINGELEKVYAVASAGESLCEKFDRFTEKKVFATIIDLVTEGLINEKLIALQNSIREGAIRL